MITKITIQGDTFSVEWRCGKDPECNDDEILDCPAEMLARYREPLILYCCKVEEEEKSQKRKANGTDNKLVEYFDEHYL